MDRRDSRGRVLRKGEYQRKGGYGYRHVDPMTGEAAWVYDQTLDGLRRKERRLADDARDGVGREGRRMSLSDAERAWAEARMGDVGAGLLRRSTLDGYLYLWSAYVEGSRLARRRVAGLDAAAVTDHYKSLLRGGLSIGTVETVHTVVSQVVGLAAQRGWCRSNVARGALAPISRASRARERAEGRRDRARCLSAAERSALLDALGARRFGHYAPIVRLLLHTGLRAGELCGLTWDDVDAEGGSLSVRRTLGYRSGATGRMEFVCNPPKTATSRRRLALSGAARADLADWMALGVACEAQPCGLGGLAFCTPRGRALTYRAVNKELARVAAAANLAAGGEVVPPGVTAHWLRHTFVTDAIESGMPVPAVSAYVGHEDVRVTLRVYYECRPEYMAASVAMLDGIEAAVTGVDGAALPPLAGTRPY